jgi:Penicillin amidase
MATGPRWGIAKALCVGLLLATSSLGGPALRAEPLSARMSSGAVAGLEAPGEIIVDVWGIPHIYAGSEHDLFLLQGYNAARDRLWQIDLWRKRGLDLLARDFGPAYVEQDRALRLFLYRGDMAAEWAAYGPKARTAAEAFVAGVNAYVAGCGPAACPCRSSSRSPGPCPILVGRGRRAGPQPRADPQRRLGGDAGPRGLRRGARRRPAPGQARTALDAEDPGWAGPVQRPQGCARGL